MEGPIFENQDDAMMGLLAGVTTVMEILVAKEIVPSETLAESLAVTRSDFEKKEMSDAVVMIELMRQPLLDPMRADARILLRSNLRSKH